MPLLALLGLALSAHAAPESPGFALVQVTGVDDDCCAVAAQAALASLPFVSAAAVAVDGKACVALKGPVDLAAMQAALAPGGYGADKVEPVAACPEALAPKRPDPWADIAGLDITIVSRGEEVDLAPRLAPGKFTVVEFGAPWCAPCYPAADRLKAYLREHADTAVRAVVLDGPDAKASYALPVVKQHLQWAEGLPYFLAYGPTGKVLYKGSDVDAALAAIEKKRK